jgi:hypothetical protein
LKAQQQEAALPDLFNVTALTSDGAIFFSEPAGAHYDYKRCGSIEYYGVG